MKKLIVVFVLIFTNTSSFCQSEAIISTIDVSHFWEAYDSLVRARTNQDSIDVIQRLYINRATIGFKDFIKARNLSAKEYAKVLGRFPKFWSSIRINTSNLDSKKKEIENVFAEYKKRYPDFTAPRICFAIGCLRTGGTVTSDQILIGTEIAASDRNTEKSELKPWLRKFLGVNESVVEFVAHEAVHTQQRFSFITLLQYRKNKLLTASVREGAADFVSKEIIHRNINQFIHAYGNEHLDELKKEFANEKGNDYSRWLYNGSTSSSDRPADLGYFIGYKICESYYLKAKNKQKALAVLMRTNNPKKILRKSGFFKK